MGAPKFAQIFCGGGLPLLKHSLLSTSEVRLPAVFNRLAWSNLAAQSAEQIGLAATPIIAVLAFGAGAGETGLLQTAQTLPFLLLSIPVGLLADRVSRRRLMAWAESVRVAALIGVLALLYLGWLTLPLLALIGFIGASGTVAYSVAAPALAPALVSPDALTAANGRLELARSAAFAAGPAIAGALIGWTGAIPAFGCAAVVSAGAVCLLAYLDEPDRPPRPPRHPIHDLREGATFALTHRLLRPVLLTAVCFNTSYFMLQTMYVPYAVHKLGMSASGVGATLAAYGIGMASAALLAPSAMRRLPFGIAVTIGPIAGLAASIIMALTIWLPSARLAWFSYFLFGSGPALWTIGSTTLRQVVTPEALLGRVSAINTTATYGSRPLGAALGAMVGATYGAETCLLAATLGFMTQALVILASPVPRLARQPEPTACSELRTD